MMFDKRIVKSNLNQENINIIDKQYMKNFYLNNKNMTDFIFKQFDDNKGIKLRAAFKWKYPTNNKPPVAYPTKDNSSTIATLNYTNISELWDYKTQHIFDYIFDNNVFNSKLTHDLDKHILGISSVIDLDSHYINRTISSRRYDCLGYYGKNVMNYFNLIGELIKDELQEVDCWDECKILFSGNGIYYILENFYGNYETVKKLSLKFVELMHDVNSFCIDNNLPDLIDTTKKLIPVKYTQFHKIPFTLHYKYERLSLPLNKDDKFDINFLKKYSDVTYLTNNPKKIDYIIKKSGWCLNDK